MECLINHESNHLNYYLAGRFEEKGKISLFKNHKFKSKKNFSIHPRIDMHFRTLKEAELFQTNFGGKIFYRRGDKVQPLHWAGGGRKKLYRIVMPSTSAIDFVNAISPFIYSDLMKRKLNLILDVNKWVQKNFHKRGKYYKEKRKKFYTDMKRLNKL